MGVLTWLDVVSLVALVAVPYAFLTGLIRGRFLRAGALSQLLRQLESVGGARLEPAVAAALADPSAQIVYWLPERGRYADREGRPVELPAPETGRAATGVTRDGRTVGAIIHDRALAEEPQLLRSVSSAAALSLDNERLGAELRVRVDELERSRAELLRAAEEERRRLERDLHDGAQQRLVRMRLLLSLADRHGEKEPPTGIDRSRLVRQARDELDSALAELRDLARGLHPAVLSNRGLPAAVQSLVSRSAVPVTILELPTRRLPRPIESAAYFLVAEALTNVDKHARATRVTVRVGEQNGTLHVHIDDDGIGGAIPSPGSGLQGLTARLAALDGVLRINSGTGTGTGVHAEIPL